MNDNEAEVRAAVLAELKRDFVVAIVRISMAIALVTYGALQYRDGLTADELLMIATVTPVMAVASILAGWIANGVRRE
jgi:hypothetical protein